MKKIIGFLLRSIFLIHFIFGNDVYQSIRVFNSTPEIIKIIAQAGIPLDHVSGKKVFILMLLRPKIKRLS